MPEDPPDLLNELLSELARTARSLTGSGGALVVATIETADGTSSTVSATDGTIADGNCARQLAVGQLPTLAPASHGMLFSGGIRGGMIVHAAQSPAAQTTIDGLCVVAQTALRGMIAAQSGHMRVDRFLDALAHDLRTPLTPALLLSGLVAEESGISASGRDHLRMLDESLAWQTRLVDDLLDHTRMRTHRSATSAGAADVHAAVRRACEWCQRDADDKSVRIVLRLTDHEATARAETARLERVAWNLLAHAVAATPERGEITLTTESSPGLVRLIVSDAGKPIASEDLALFFHRLPGDGCGAELRAGSQGAGLLVARELAEAWGGSLIAEDSPGGGRFVLTLIAGE